MKKKYKSSSKQFYLIGAVAILLSQFFVSCRKNLQIEPPVSGLVRSEVFANNLTAAAAVTDIYQQMSNAGFSDGPGSIGLEVGLSSDELLNYNANDPTLPGLYTNSLSPQNKYFWTELYQDIYKANADIEGLTASSNLTAPLKQQLIGETKFLRAFFHFYAVNLYGDVPLVLTTDYRINNAISRTAVPKVYQQIIADLHDAQNNLSSNFLTPTGVSTSERIRPNKGAATALLARAYLYTENWVGADSAATAVINNSALYQLVPDLNGVFLTNSNEAIWQLQSVAPGLNTYDAIDYVLTSAPGSFSNPVALSDNLFNAFEPNDKRQANWTGTYTADSITYYHFPYKYKVYSSGDPITEYTMVLRLAEQYLIRAEARAQQNKITGATGALADLNMIRNRAGLANYAGAMDQTSVLNAIQHERQVELFTEWGHRWFDLKRTNSINALMGSPGNVCSAKGGTWNPDWALFPIAQSEIIINPHLTQNPGYH